MRKKLILSIIFLFTLIGIFSFKEDSIFPLKLNWETDFKGDPDNRSPFFALTAMTWQYSYESVLYRNRISIKLKNEINVDKDRSWVKLDKIKDPQTSARLLHHEQGHANIQYVLLLEADRVLKNRTYSTKNYKTEIAKLANEISHFFDTMQKNYDKETEHGSNHKMQARWDVIIQDKMAESIAASMKLK